MIPFDSRFTFGQGIGVSAFGYYWRRTTLGLSSRSQPERGDIEITPLNCPNLSK
jgi:hypothetical protein